jgi:hemoglobin-like flavoprotein
MPVKDFLHPKQKEQLQATLRNSNSPLVREGALILLLINEGRNSKEISNLIGCSYRTVAYWNIHSDPDKIETLRVPPDLKNDRKTTISSDPDTVETLETQPVMKNLDQTTISSNPIAVETLETQPVMEKSHKTRGKSLGLLNAKVLEDSFALVKPQAGEFAFSFYNNLFDDYPQLQPLFASTNMEEQEKKLIMSLVLVINNLRNLSYLKTLLKDLGTRHVNYGIVREYYPMVGAALLKTFESYLGAKWTPEVKQAWADGYEAIANLMLEGN